MGIGAFLAFALGMLLLSASPGPGLAAVLSRSMTSGAKSGAMVVVGLVLVDFLFLGLAILGLSAIAATFGPLFQVVKYAAALYLIWLGYKTIKNARNAMTITPAVSTTTSHLKDISLGAIVTLGNPKAILFYGAFLPTFFDISRVGIPEYSLICIIIIAVSFLVYGAYIVLAGKSLHFFSSSKLQKRLHQTTGAVFIGSGAIVALR